MAANGEQEQAYKLKQELSEQKDAAHMVTEELAEAQRTLSRQSSETHRIWELAEAREQQHETEIQAIKEQYTKQLQDQAKTVEELRKAQEQVQLTLQSGFQSEITEQQTEKQKLEEVIPNLTQQTGQEAAVEVTDESSSTASGREEEENS